MSGVNAPRGTRRHNPLDAEPPSAVKQSSPPAPKPEILPKTNGATQRADLKAHGDRIKQKTQENLLKAEAEAARQDGEAATKDNQPSAPKQTSSGDQLYRRTQAMDHKIERMESEWQQTTGCGSDLLPGVAADRGLPTASLALESDLGKSGKQDTHIEATLTQSSITPDPNLRNFSTVTGTFETSIYRGSELPFKINKAGEIELALQNEGAPVSVEAKGLVGNRLTVEGRIPAEGDGKNTVPNPFDPLSMPVGSAIVVKNEKVATGELAFRYKQLNLESRTAFTDGNIARGVERLDDNRVRIYSGPTQGVENEVYAGVGNDLFQVGVQMNDGLNGTQVQTADINLNTQAGRDAYNRFMLTGQVPTNGAGVERSGETGAVVFEKDSSVRINIGEQVQGNIELTGSQIEHQVTDYTDYTSGKPEIKKDITTTYTPYSDRSLEINRTYDQRGVLVANGSGEKPYNLVMAGVDSQSAVAAAGAFDEASGTRANDLAGRGRQDVRLSFTDAEAKELCRLAKDYVTKNQPRGNQLVLQKIAIAGSTDEVMTALADGLSNGETAAELQFLSIYYDRPLPGSVEFQDVP